MHTYLELCTAKISTAFQQLTCGARTQHFMDYKILPNWYMKTVFGRQSCSNELDPDSVKKQYLLPEPGLILSAYG